MTNRKIDTSFAVDINGFRHIVVRDASSNPTNLVHEHKVEADEHTMPGAIYQLDPAKYVAIKQQVNKINRFYKAEAETRLTELFAGLFKRLETPTGPRFTDINTPKKWVTR